VAWRFQCFATVTMISIKNILVATDFSKAADTALTYGRALAGQFQATLHVINVRDRFFTIVGLEGYMSAPTGLRYDAVDSATTSLEATITADDRRRLQVKTAVLSSSSPALSIVDYATRFNIDLIIIGSHGHSGIAHLLLRGVAEKIAECAPCPVLTVKTGEHEFVIEDAVERGDCSMSLPG
jgi:nucleotide-binding universal stress UspA family protein